MTRIAVYLRCECLKGEENTDTPAARCSWLILFVFSITSRDLSVLKLNRRGFCLIKSKLPEQLFSTPSNSFALLSYKPISITTNNISLCMLPLSSEFLTIAKFMLSLFWSGRNHFPNSVTEEVSSCKRCFRKRWFFFALWAFWHLSWAFLCLFQMVR